MSSLHAPTLGSTWYEAAAYRGADVETFFPACGTAATRQIRAALTYCARCPVTTACLTAAMAEERTADRNRLYGVRGGLTAADRRRLHDQKRQAVA